MARILVVEDHKWNGDMHCRRLIRRGSRIFVAYDGQEGMIAA